MAYPVQNMSKEEIRFVIPLLEGKSNTVIYTVYVKNVYTSLESTISTSYLKMGIQIYNMNLRQTVTGHRFTDKTEETAERIKEIFRDERTFNILDMADFLDFSNSQFIGLCVMNLDIK